MVSHFLQLHAVALPVVVLAAQLCGCAGTVEGPQRFQLTGSVTLDGKPVPAGTIELNPDSSKGNHGPGTYVIVKDGFYKAEGKNGVLGGSYQARIQVFDGVPTDPSSELGSRIGKIRTVYVEFPGEDSTFDFVL